MRSPTPCGGEKTGNSQISFTGEAVNLPAVALGGAALDRGCRAGSQFALADLLLAAGAAEILAAVYGEAGHAPS